MNQNPKEDDKPTTGSTVAKPVKNIIFVQKQILQSRSGFSHFGPEKQLWFLSALRFL